MLIITSEVISKPTSKALDININENISTFSMLNLLNLLLQVQNFAVVRLKSKFVEVKEFKDVKRQQEFNNSI